MRKSILTLLIIFFSSVSESQINFDSSLVAFWPFYGSVEDLGPDEIDGIANGCELETGWDGQIQSAFSFDGLNDYIQMNGPVDNFEIPFTVVLHIKPADLEALVLFSTCSVPDGYSGISVNVSGGGLGKIAVSFYDGGDIGAENRRSKVSDGVLTLNEWNCVVCEVNGPTDMEIYINGENAGGVYSGSGDALVHSDNPCLIGSVANADTYFEGSVDDVRLYNRLFTEEELEVICETEYSPVSLEETNIDLLVYPNPAKDKLIIESEVDFQRFKIFNSVGQMVRNQVLDTEYNIDVSELEYGSYVLVLEGDQMISYRFIIQD